MERLQNQEKAVHSFPIDTGGGGGNDGGMDRIDNLERAVTRLEGDIGAIKVDFGAMRNDMSEIRIALADLNSKLNIGEIRANVEKAHTDIYKWVATIAISVAGLGFAIYAGLKSTAQPPQQQPTVQYVLPSPQSAPSSATIPPPKHP
ncbi:hypothetical protein [Burkholderia ubonensis]|uniref:hypothetical protein n=1 Tax=Burkholderia ubonensis TaxID=101571 RepID=UPI0012F9FE67|nr:hypothetical protein [Burkholderia ubonensis]